MLWSLDCCYICSQILCSADPLCLLNKPWQLLWHTHTQRMLMSTCSSSFINFIATLTHDARMVQHWMQSQVYFGSFQFKHIFHSLKYNYLKIDWVILQRQRGSFISKIVQTTRNREVFVLFVFPCFMGW